MCLCLSLSHLFTRLCLSLGVVLLFQCHRQDVFLWWERNCNVISNLVTTPFETPKRDLVFPDSFFFFFSWGLNGTLVLATPTQIYIYWNNDVNQLFWSPYVLGLSHVIMTTTLWNRCVYFPPSHRWGNRSSGILSNFPKITQLDSKCWLWIQTTGVWILNTKWAQRHNSKNTNIT